MFFIDALLCHNIFPLQHWVQRRGVLLEALFKISEGFLFGPHHLIMAALLYFEEKVHRKKLLRADAIPLLFPDCYARFWSTWDTHLSLSLSANAFAKRYSLSTKWTSMTTYGVEPRAPAGPEHPKIPHPEQQEEPQLVHIPADMKYLPL
ncbi:hypothetical protein CK203_087220 [Vitis vinifera]|uniref:Uncharacterized protein n=1 Tax=Vitis vinifera TaxID=29760 RepID=A0A438BRZ5_VITVI|nr:hypothetical protein CK203_087220 [Vitis vinifera]